MKNGISTWDAARILKVKLMRLNDWLHGYFNPMTRARGRDTRTYFSISDLYRLGVMKLIVEGGFGREKAGEICEKIRELEHAGKLSFKDDLIIIRKSDRTGFVDTIYGIDADDRWPKNLAYKMGEEDNAVGPFPSNLIIDLKIVKEIVDLRMG
jgi:hypothetical protein